MDTILSKIENCKIVIPMIIIILLIIICIAVICICCWGSKPKRFREKCLCALIWQEYRKKRKTSERDGLLPC